MTTGAAVIYTAIGVGFVGLVSGAWFGSVAAGRWVVRIFKADNAREAADHD